MPTVQNICFAKEETCRWQKTDLTTWKRWHKGTDVKLTFTTTGSNVFWKDLQIDWWLCLVGMLQKRSETDDLERLCISLGEKNYLVKWEEHYK